MLNTENAWEFKYVLRMVMVYILVFCVTRNFSLVTDVWETHGTFILQSENEGIRFLQYFESSGSRCCIFWQVVINVSGNHGDDGQEHDQVYQ